MIKRFLGLLFCLPILIFASACSQSETDKVVNRINRLYGIEILDYAQPTYCTYQSHWDGDAYKGCFKLTSTAKEFMDSFPQVLYKFGANEEEYYLYNGWFSNENYPGDYEDAVDKVVNMLSIFDVEEVNNDYIYWYNICENDRFLMLYNDTIYFRNYTY